ncbi:MAG: hypothetical protein ACK4ND_14820 [Cytophagaceae bacterium]
MELNDFKSAWAQYDKKLSENLRLNHELLKKINLGNSKDELHKTLVYEIITVVVVFMTIVYTSVVSIRLINEPEFIISGSISILFALAYLALSLIKINCFFGVDYYGSSILKLQKDLTSLRKKVIKFRRMELLMLPVFVIALLPTFFMGIHGMNIFENVKLWLVEIFFIVGVSYPVILWIYKNLYDKKFEYAEKFLKEIEEFEAHN